MLELFIVSQYWGRPSFTLTLRTGDFIGSKTAGFPFVLAAKEDQTIYSPECVPEGFSLSYLDHLPGSGIISLYQHWLEHQKKRQAPFIVLNLSPLHGPMFKKSDKAKGKKKVDYMEVSKDPDENEDEEDDQEDGDGDEGDDSHRNEDEPPAPIPKFGPLNTKKPIVPPKTPPSLSAGPSQPCSRRNGKVNTSKNENEKAKKNSSEKKGKAEDDLDINSPTKFQKSGPVRKPVQTTTKTKGDGTKKVSFLIDDLECED